MTTTTKKPTASERLVRDRITRDLPNHVVELRHEHGAYRHYRCQRPGTIAMYFDIVTWPGSICFTGDMGDYVFRRTEDMIAFMRRSCTSYSYAAEQCVAHGSPLKEFNEDLFLEILKDTELEIQERTDDPARKAGLLADIQEARDAYNRYQHPHDAYSIMYERGVWDGADMPSCELYSFHFLWCLHAIKWFCEQIDAGKIVRKENE